MGGTAMNARRLARWTLSIALVTGVASTVLGSQVVPASSLFGAAVAPASKIDATIVYKCKIAGVLNQSLDSTISETAPASVLSGSKLALSQLRVTVVLPGSLVNLLIAYEHVTSLVGALTTFDFHSSGASPATINAPPASGWDFNLPVTKNKPATITVPHSPASLGPFTAGKSGTVSIRPGNFKMTTKFGDIVCTAPKAIPPAAIARIPIRRTSGSGLARQRRLVKR